jgi:hypothetical protein
MFNLGTKQLCMNVTEANGVISIAGFGFTIPTVAAAAGEFLMQKMQWQVCTQSLRLHLMTILKRTTCTWYSLRKILSISSDIDCGLSI